MSLSKQDLADIRGIVLDALHTIVNPRFDRIEAQLDEHTAILDQHTAILNALHMAAIETLDAVVLSRTPHVDGISEAIKSMLIPRGPS